MSETCPHLKAVAYLLRYLLNVVCISFFRREIVKGRITGEHRTVASGLAVGGWPVASRWIARARPAAAGKTQDGTWPEGVVVQI